MSATNCAYCEPRSIPFFVAAPTTTLDAKLAGGSDITIEHRPAHELTHFQGKQVAPDGIDVSLHCMPLSSHICPSGFKSYLGVLLPKSSVSALASCGQLSGCDLLIRQDPAQGDAASIQLQSVV